MLLIKEVAKKILCIFNKADPSDYSTLVLAIILFLAGLYLIFMMFIEFIVMILSFVW